MDRELPRSIFQLSTIEYRIVVYIRFGFFGKFSTPICLIKVYTFISSDIFFVSICLFQSIRFGGIGLVNALVVKK